MKAAFQAVGRATAWGAAVISGCGPALAADAGSQSAVPGITAGLLPAATADRDQAIECIATAISYEAGNEPEAGQEAVAQIVLNRLRDPAFPKTACGVVYQGSERRTGCQFTFTCDGSLARTRPARSLANARRIAALALEGSLVPSIGAATFYHAYYVSPPWAARMERITRIGAHIFYQPLTGGPRPRLPIAPGAAESAPVQTTLSVWGLKTAVLTPVGGRIEVRQP